MNADSDSGLNDFNIWLNAYIFSISNQPSSVSAIDTSLEVVNDPERADFWKVFYRAHQYSRMKKGRVLLYVKYMYGFKDIRQATIFFQLTGGDGVGSEYRSIYPQVTYTDTSQSTRIKHSCRAQLPA